MDGGLNSGVASGEWSGAWGMESGVWRVECGECRKSENAVETEWRVQWKEWFERPLEVKKV